MDLRGSCRLTGSIVCPKSPFGSPAKRQTRNTVRGYVRYTLIIVSAYLTPIMKTLIIEKSLLTGAPDARIFASVCQCPAGTNYLESHSRTASRVANTPRVRMIDVCVIRTIVEANTAFLPTVGNAANFVKSSDGSSSELLSTISTSVTVDVAFF